MRSVMAKEARQFQGHLGGVVIVALQAIPIGGGRVIAPGTDVTEEAKNWPNLPGMIKRGTVKCTPEVNANSILRGPPPTHPAGLEKAAAEGGLYVLSQEEMDARKVTVPRPASEPAPDAPVAPPKSRLTFLKLRGYTIAESDADGSKFIASLLPHERDQMEADYAAWEPAPPARPIGPGNPPPGTVPASAPPPPGVLGRGIATRLRDLTLHDSAKHIQATLKDAGRSVSGPKKEMLEVRDQLLAESQAKEAEAINLARVVDPGKVEADKAAGEDAPAGGEPPAQ